MTVEQLTEILDACGGHLAVFMEDKNGRRYNIDVDIMGTDEDGSPCLILSPIGDRIDG